MAKKKKSSRTRRSGNNRQMGMIAHPGIGSITLPPRILTRTAFATIAKTLTLDRESLLYPKEGVEGTGALHWGFLDFDATTPGWDAFRIREVEVIAKLKYPDLKSTEVFGDLTQSIEIFSRFDADSIEQKSPWNSFSHQGGLRMVSLNNRNPSKMIARFKPAVIFSDPTGGTPSDFLWSSDRWIDAVERSKIRFGSLMVFAHVNNYNHKGDNPFKVDFIAKALIQQKYIL